MNIRCNRMYISFEAIVLKLNFGYYNALAAGLYQVKSPEMGVISRVTDGESFFHTMSFCSRTANYL